MANTSLVVKDEDRLQCGAIAQGQLHFAPLAPKETVTWPRLLATVTQRQKQLLVWTITRVVVGAWDPTHGRT